MYNNIFTMLKIRHIPLFRVHINTLVFATLLLMSITEATKPEETKCDCSEAIENISGSINRLRIEVDANIELLKRFAPLYPFVLDLRNKMREEDFESIVKRLLDKYVLENRHFPRAESIIMKPEDGMMNDSVMLPKITEEDNDLVKNVSNLLAKVEKVENRTMEVEEELKSERRVRRHLEQEVKETQSSIIFLEDQLQNVTVPVDAVMSHVQMVIISSIEDMNRTIYEDHLQKLYYKVDGVVYKNETRELGERINHVEAEMHEGFNSSTISKLAEEVKNLEENIQIINSSIGEDLVPRMIMLESETVRKEATEVLEDKMTDLLNTTEQFKKELSSVWSDIQDVQSFQQKLVNFSMEWSKSLEDLQIQMNELKNKTSIPVTSNYVGQTIEDPYDMDDVVRIDPVTQIKNETDLELESIFRVIEDVTSAITSKYEESETTAWETEDTVTPSIINRLRIGGSSETYTGTCDVPVNNDPHLLIDTEIEPDGTQKLIFGCRPIGEYILNNPPIPVRCEGGSWSGPFPTCHSLRDANSIETLSKELTKEYPCTAGSGEYPDPTNCTRFFKCSHGRVYINPCPAGLHFNANLKVCDYPSPAACKEVISDSIQELKDLIPPILIEPNNLDKPSGLLGTGPAGQLIVHPRSSFTLHCLYPRNNWGYPSWNVTYSKSDALRKHLIPRNGINKVSLTIIAAKEEDGGLYKCITPFGKAHGISVLVQVVQCPVISLGEEYEEVFYRPTPEGESRILGTTAEFPCMEGRIIAICMANGNWSRGPPDESECTLRKRCKPFDTSNNQDLILDEEYASKTVYFKCARGLRLLGDFFTRCLDDGTWSHSSLPKCV